MTMSKNIPEKSIKKLLKRKQKHRVLEQLSQSPKKKKIGKTMTRKISLNLKIFMSIQSMTVSFKQDKFDAEPMPM